MLYLCFCGFLAFGFLIGLILLRPRAEESVLLRRLSTIITPPKLERAGDDLSLAKHSSGLTNSLGGYLLRFDFSEHLQLLIVHAGSKATVGSVAVGSLLVAAGLGFLAHVTVGLLPLTIVATFIGMWFRVGLLKSQRSRRLKQFNTALPDAIDLLARALRAGHSMSSALEVVSQQSAEPLASEFDMVFQQQKFGIQFREVLLQLGKRVPSKDLQFLVTAILVQKETGGDLTEVLDRTTRIIRERVRIQGEVQTYTAQGRLTGWILGSLPVVMLALINVITPGYSHMLFHDPTGQKLLYGGAALITIGGLAIRKIVTIEV